MQEFVMEEICTDGSVMCESAGEYTLPDYMPEVRRVLRVTADATVAGQYERGERTEVGGDTRYTLLYTDPEGKLAVAEQDGTFEGAVNVPAGMPLMVYPSVENVSCRLAGPRKVSLRAGVCLHPQGYQSVTVTPPEVGEHVGATEMLCHRMHTAETKYFHVGEVALTDSVTCEAGAVPLTSEARVLVREVKCEDGIVRVRGEVWAQALCNREDGTPATYTTKIPFEEMIPCDGVMPDFTGVARSNCRRVGCEMSDSGNLLFDITAVIDGMAVKNRVCDVVTDLYAMSYEMRPKTKRIAGRWYPTMQMANFTVDGAVPRETLGVGDTPLKPVDAHAVVASASCTTDGSVVTVEGELRVSCVLACEESDGSYRAESFDLPYKVRVTCKDAIPQDTMLACDVTCISCRARADGARLSTDAELSVMLVGTKQDACEIILSAEPDPDTPVARADDEIVSVYLSDGDSLWSIAKRYHVPLADIAQANSLPEEAMEEPDFVHHLDGLTRLMVV